MTSWITAAFVIALAVVLQNCSGEVSCADDPVCARRLEHGVSEPIHLSWQDDPSTTLTVTWLSTGAETSPVVQYRAGDSERWQDAVGASFRDRRIGFINRVTLRELTPDTRYEYRIAGSGGRASAAATTHQTRTAPARGPADFTFAFIADTGIEGRSDGNASGIRPIIEAIDAEAPLFILGGGDYAYANRDDRFGTVRAAVDAWFHQMQPLFSNYPFMAQYGNHEVLLAERFNDWAPRFAHPHGSASGRREAGATFPGRVEDEVNYSFDVGDVHFTALFVPEPSPPPQRLLWLENDLADARRRGRRWLIVYHHAPIFAHGHSHPADPRVRKALAPIFEKYGVDLHISAHDQNYERTCPLSGAATDPTCTSPTSSTYASPRGVVYAKISPSGKMSEQGNMFSRFTVPRQDFIVVRNDDAHHYGVFKVRKSDEISVEVYAIAADSGDKRLIDSFTLTKLATSPSRGS